MPSRNFFVLLLILLVLGPHPATETKTKNVLVLSGGRGRDSINRMASSMRARFPDPVNLSIVDLDNPRFDQTAYQDHFAEALRGAYASQKPDLVLAVMTPSLEFAVKYHERLFPQVPIVFMSVSTPIPEKMWPGVTGVHSPMGTTELINLALRLHPDTEHVAVVTNVNDVIDKDWLDAEHAELLHHRPHVDEIDFIGPPSPELLQKVAALPPHTVVLFQLFPKDSDQLAFGAYDVLAPVADRLPTYSILPLLDRGAVGSATYDAVEDAVLAGQLAARVLSGERPDDIPVVENANVLMSVDWRQLRRWNIPESALPLGTRVVHREPTIWQRYWKYMIVAGAVMFVQSLLIVGLLRQRARKQRAESAIRESEQRFRLVTNTAPVMIWMSDPSQSRTYFNRPWLDFVGRPLEAELGTGWTTSLHPEDVQSTHAICARSFNLREPFHIQHRLRRHDGEFRWVLDTGVPRFNADGSFAGYIGSCLDITERKLAEEALASLGGKLIAAQEQERTRIARELHDDINQQLALLSVSLDELRHNSEKSDTVMRSGLGRLGAQASEISRSVKALSHRLHSSKLEYLGLLAALRGFCREFSDQHRVEIRLSHDPIPDDLPREISLCLFRVVQAAVVNAFKHSGAKTYDIHLGWTAGRVHLRIHDAGVGFDPDKALTGHGLGLLSMRERVHFVDGEISIRSKANQGTTIEVSVPIPAETMTSQSA